ncbi:MAG: DUF6176 family protein [Chloroflexota bacterium]|nr:DUF6176 family protein [Chloroflexota bacterium]
MVFRRVREDQVDRLREWMNELTRRQDEVRQTFANERVRHEQAFLIEAREGPVLVYAIEVEDEEQARKAYESSTLPIDHQHRQVMDTVLAGPAAVDLLYDVRVA